MPNPADIPDFFEFDNKTTGRPAWRCKKCRTIINFGSRPVCNCRESYKHEKKILENQRRREEVFNESKPIRGTYTLYGNNELILNH